MNRKPGDAAAVEDGLPAKYAVADHLGASFRSHVGASSAAVFIMRVGRRRSWARDNLSTLGVAGRRYAETGVVDR